jgi:2-amino-4-hydroxy-6-hydroxymethyldihydropteridine diphosphokinase
MNQTSHSACLLLGSNIQPEKNIPLCVELLRKQLTILKISSVWESKAVGSDGPNFLNAALLISTLMDVTHLKEQLIHPLEAQLGRVRTEDKNSPRTIDIDLILYDQQLLDPNLWKYSYRAVPVAEVLPEYQSQSGEYLKAAAELLARSMPIQKRTDVLFVPTDQRAATR